jgi:hypothetical protein
VPESSRTEPREMACAVLSVVACVAAMVANISQSRPRYMVQSDSKFVGHLGDRLLSVKKLPFQLLVSAWSRRSGQRRVLASRSPCRRAANSRLEVSETPVRAVAVEQALDAGTPYQEAARLASDGLNPTPSLRASAEYKLHLTRVLTRRVVEEAAARR